MEKDQKILLGIVITIIIITIVIVLTTVKVNHKKKTISDAIKFKEEYELLNNKKNKETNEVFLNLKISEDNIVNYLNEEDALKKIQDGSGIFYLGYPSSQKCRFIIETLLKVFKDNNIKKLYYLNIYNIRDEYEIKDKKMLEIKHGSDTYYKMLEYLDEYLSDYTLTNEKGKNIKTGVKRINEPTIIMIRNGKVLAFNDTLVDLVKDPTKKPNKVELQKLKKELETMLKEYNKNNCIEESC